MEEQSFDQVANVVPEDYELTFTTEGMPDPNLNELDAKLSVHRVYPVNIEGYPVAKHAVVLIHGRSVPGPVVFDLRFPPPDGGDLSVQEALARAGIDTFAPSLLGYGNSTRFNLDDPVNASFRGFPTDPVSSAVLSCTFGGVSPPEGCDVTSNAAIFPLDQQGTMLLNNPLGGKRQKHTSNVRFARTDVWVRDIRQVIDSAIARSGRKKVALVGYSAGGQHVGRTLYRMMSEDTRPLKVSSVVFLNSLFFAGGPKDEPPTIAGPTFPLTLNDRLGSDANWQMKNEPLGGCREAESCSGHIIPGIQQQVWCQTLMLDSLGSTWGGRPDHPTGLNRSPTFVGYGWNNEVAGKLEIPTLVMQGLKDTVVPTGTPVTAQTIYDNLATKDKVLVLVECASHALPWEGCSGDRCTPPPGTTPYGGEHYRGSTTAAGAWTGPHATLKAALIEWIKHETFNGKRRGSWNVDQSGVASAATAAT